MHTEPAADRPHMPGYGIASGAEGMLAWEWAVQRLMASRTYWVATTGPDGAPHLAAVWAVWSADRLCFSTGARSVKARNLAHEPRCAITPGDADEAVVIEGVTERVTDAAVLAELASVYTAKYGSGFPDAAIDPVFAVRPLRAFGMDTTGEAFTRTATRWRFSPD
jgi:pyridoxamine 5'-phosphate oxidase-like protein